jgi:hypothetical protein
MENFITLPVCKSEVFQIFVHWLYFGHLPEPMDIGGIRPGCPLWVLADRLLVSDLKSVVMRDLYSLHSS